MKKILCVVICMLMCVTTGLVTGTQTEDKNTTPQVILANDNQNRAMWDVQFQIDVGGITGSTQLGPAGFDGTYFYCPEWSTTTIHQFDKDGSNHTTFTIPGVSSCRDIEYDGQYFYGGNGAGLFLWQMDFTNHLLVTTYTFPVAVRSVAYDKDHDAFWVNVWSSDLKLVDRTGATLDTLAAPESLYGSAWDDITQISGYDGPFLWVFTGTSSGTDGIIKCYDLATKTLTTTTHNVAQELGAGIAGGLFITPDYASGLLTLGGCVQATANDYLFGYEIATTNAPPDTPGAPTGPSNGVKNVDYSFTATTTDPEGDPIEYMFDWGDGNFSAWVTPGTASHAWTTEGTFNVKAKARDAVHMGESDWSPAHPITIVGAPILNIEWIKGGLFKVSASIKNSGGVPATSVQWKITLTGGAFIGKETTGTIDSLAAGAGATIKSALIIGFGATVVKVEATCTASSDSMEKPGKVILFIIKI